MKSGLRGAALAEATEGALKRLGYGYSRSGAGGVVEFEVSSPAPFVVRITQLEEVEHVSSVFGAGFPSVQPVASDFALESDQAVPASREAGARLVAEVRGSLKAPPWKGLGVVEGMTARALWERAARP